MNRHYSRNSGGSAKKIKELPLCSLVWRTLITIVFYWLNNGVEQEVQKRQEILNMTAQEIVAKLTELSGDSIQLATIGRVLVESNPQLAETLQFLISVELEDKHRRENDADKI